MKKKFITLYINTWNLPNESTKAVAEVIQIYKNRSKLVDKAPGFIDFKLLQNQKRPTFVTVHLTWEAREDYLKWVRSDGFKAIHDLERKYPDQELANIIPKDEQSRL